jgi:protein-arginine kinase activator protein McsA
MRSDYADRCIRCDKPSTNWTGFCVDHQRKPCKDCGDNFKPTRRKPRDRCTGCQKKYEQRRRIEGANA